jgi:hypothetical protein
LCKSYFCEFTIASQAPCARVYCCIAHFGEGESPGVERIFSPVFLVTVESSNYLILIICEFLHYWHESGVLVWCDGVRSRERDCETPSRNASLRRQWRFSAR